jgi:hypothetical protein
MLDNSALGDGTQVKRVTVYEPSIDTAIDPARFTFQPKK